MDRENSENRSMSSSNSAQNTSSDTTTKNTTTKAPTTSSNVEPTTNVPTTSSNVQPTTNAPTTSSNVQPTTYATAAAYPATPTFPSPQPTPTAQPINRTYPWHPPGGIEIIDRRFAVTRSPGGTFTELITTRFRDPDQFVIYSDSGMAFDRRELIGTTLPGRRVITGLCGRCHCTIIGGEMHRCPGS